MSKPAIAMAQEGPRFEVVRVDVKLAQEWLGKNTHNRNIRPNDVLMYARDMTVGDWQFTAEAIKFDVDGNLLDGQHRLYAILAANVTLPMLVVWGLDPKAQESMDTGIKRSAGDTLRLRHYPNVNTLGAVARHVIQWKAGQRWGRDGRFKLSKAELIEAVEADELIRDASLVAAGYAKRIQAPTSVTGTCYWIFAGIDRAATDDFFEKLAVGADLPENHPVLTLRNRLAQIKGSPGRWLSTERYIALFCRVWNAYRDGRLLKAAYIATGKKGSDGEEVYPEPH